MPTSPYFNLYGQTAEQRLMEDLIVEHIRQWGIDVRYIPRNVEDKDEIYGEDRISTYDSNYLVEMYIKNVDGYEGDQVFLSKFNMEIRDQITFSVTIRAFDQEVKQYNNQRRPNEGDLIWITLNPNRPQLMVVKYVNDRSIFFQLGDLQVYDLVCETFEYSSERFNTGIAELDNIEDDLSYDLVSYGLITGDGDLLTDADGYPLIRSSDYNTDGVPGIDSRGDNLFFEEEAVGIIDFSEADPFTEGNF